MLTFQPTSDHITTATESLPEGAAAPIKPVVARQVRVGLLSNLQSKTWEISCQLATDLGFGNLIQGRSDNSFRVFCFDVTATVMVMREYPAGNGKGPGYAIDGVGMRICILVAKNSTTIGVSLDDVAARVTGSTIFSQKQAISYGLLPTTDLAIQALLNGPFDISFFAQLTKACTTIGADLNSRVGGLNVYKLEEAQLAPIPSYHLEHAISTSYCLHSQVKGWSYDQFMTRQKNKVQSGDTKYDYLQVADLLVKSYYPTFMGTTAFDTRPSKTQIEAAKKLYDGCRPS